MFLRTFFDLCLLLLILLGPAYLDENVSPQMSPIYLGIWFTFATMGPALGFAIGGAFLKVYTDIDMVRQRNIIFRNFFFFS